MNGRLIGKVALVTGAGSGIGRAAAIVFAREGAKVILCDIMLSECEEMVRLIKQIGGNAISVKTDVSKAVEVEALIRKAVETYGRLDCTLNNAGVEGESKELINCSEENWDKVINVNLKGVWLCLKYEIVQMIKQGGGSIVNISSIAGLVGVIQRPAYVASKHGVIGLTKAAAVEYGNRGIRINAICPGVIRTQMVDTVFKSIPGLEKKRIEQHPIGRFGSPEEVAEAALWLCSDAASFVTGCTMTVDGGFTAQ